MTPIPSSHARAARPFALRRWPHWASWVVVAVIAGCGARDDTDAARPRGVASVPRSNPALPEIRPATAEEVMAAVREPGARVVMVNVWATWCAPCREEFPDLMRVYARYRDRGLRLVLVSADFDDQLPQARRFLAQNGVDFATFHKVGDDMRFINSLEPRWTGALPATLVFDGHGVLRDFWEGRAPLDRFEQRVLEVIQSDQASKEDPS